MNNATFSLFTTQLKERRPEIADFLHRCELNHLTHEDYTAMRNSLRRLVEMSENQHAQIHKLALAMQDAINPKNFAAQINMVSLCRTLLSACHEALLTTKSEAQAFIPAHSITIRGQKPVVLSVDDDRIVHHMVEGMFGNYVMLLTAGNGVQGLEMIHLKRPDLILLDDAMPLMSGMRMIETLHADELLATIPVIMLTSSDRPQDLERATAAGAVDYVIKPFNPKLLADAVYKALYKLALQ